MNVCFCSNVTNSYLLIDAKNLGDSDLIFTTLNYQKLEQVLDSSILEILRRNIALRLDELLAEFKSEIVTFHTKLSFFYRLGEKYGLYLNNPKHFLIGMLIGIEELISSTLKKNGFVYIYNIDLLEENYMSNILLTLKRKFRLSQVDIFKEISLLNERYNLQNNFNVETLNLALSKLIHLGLIDIDKEEKYCLTGRGFLINV